MKKQAALKLLADSGVAARQTASSGRAVVGVGQAGAAGLQQADVRVGRVGRLGLAVQGAAQRVFHVRLARAQPDVADQQVRDRLALAPRLGGQGQGPRPAARAGKVADQRPWASAVAEALASPSDSSTASPGLAAPHTRIGWPRCEHGVVGEHRGQDGRGRGRGGQGGGGQQAHQHRTHDIPYLTHPGESRDPSGLDHSGLDARLETQLDPGFRRDERSRYSAFPGHVAPAGSVVSFTPCSDTISDPGSTARTALVTLVTSVPAAWKHLSGTFRLFHSPTGAAASTGRHVQLAPADRQGDRAGRLGVQAVIDQQG